MLLPTTIIGPRGAVIDGVAKLMGAKRAPWLRAGKLGSPGLGSRVGNTR